MDRADAEASSSAGPSTPLMPPTPKLPQDRSAKKNHKQSLRAKDSAHKSGSASVPSSKKTFVNKFLTEGKWTGPEFIYDDDLYATSEDELDNCHKGSNESSAARRTKKKAKQLNTGGKDNSRLFRLVKTYTGSLDNDDVRAAGMRILHIFLRSILPPPDVLLLGTRFSSTLCPRCTCHSKRKAGDALQDALDSVKLSDCNPHQFDRVLFPITVNSRWFVALVTGAQVILYDPSGHVHLDASVVQHLCNQIADAFEADAAKRAHNAKRPPKYVTHIISPDELVDLAASVMLACAAIEVLTSLPIINETIISSLHLVLAFLAECAANEVSMELFKSVLSKAYDECSATDTHLNNDKGQSMNGAKGESSSQPDKTHLLQACERCLPPAPSAPNTFKPAPRVDAPKVPFKAKRRAKSKKPLKTSPSPALETGSGDSNEVARILTKLSKADVHSPKLQDTLLDRIVFICKTGLRPGDEFKPDLCNCYACSLLGALFM